MEIPSLPGVPPIDRGTREGGLPQVLTRVSGQVHLFRRHTPEGRKRLRASPQSGSSGGYPRFQIEADQGEGKNHEVGILYLSLFRDQEASFRSSLSARTPEDEGFLIHSARAGRKRSSRIMEERSREGVRKRKWFLL
ncbi:hypothetical protein NPIL_67331 [Nephila pilipes]|uniref:Uncharacterized protein n=1 Tax=Nephila pilipes TaxID=299642 RepID=A0A8X6NFY5_NEPPI|nr:hypothetical protein NPIL_67331 [Nephila pilipes]